ncbi:hypothetical protein DIPPA_23516 [Diplonema papillatum]|nr:hypothetical protein DIPPA_23516 [Diplonema papillatum]KAJ9471274.1 hypothetical protein DIPPA_23516 [Diplonema papillatum]KAJ9471275.1 hypothetical protein DIPPA_23516 [Diplonema papillatum]
MVAEHTGKLCARTQQEPEKSRKNDSIEGPCLWMLRNHPVSCTESDGGLMCVRFTDPSADPNAARGAASACSAASQSSESSLGLSSLSSITAAAESACSSPASSYSNQAQPRNDVEFRRDDTQRTVSCRKPNGDFFTSSAATLIWTGGPRSRPCLLFPDTEHKVYLPSDDSHLALILPDLCHMFSASGITHNLHRWGLIDEANVFSARSRRNPEARCACAVM